MTLYLTTLTPNITLYQHDIVPDNSTLSTTLEIIIHDRNNSEIQSSINKEFIGMLTG